MMPRKQCCFKFNAVNSGDVANSHSAMASLTGASTGLDGSRLGLTITRKIATAREAFVILGDGSGGRGLSVILMFQATSQRGCQSGAIRYMNSCSTD